MNALNYICFGFDLAKIVVEMIKYMAIPSLEIISNIFMYFHITLIKEYIWNCIHLLLCKTLLLKNISHELI